MIRISGVLFALFVVFAWTTVHAENVLDNPDFDTDLSSWSCAPGNGVVLWDSRDVDGAPGSGSAQIDNDAPSANAKVSCVQCVPVTEGDPYRLSARVYFADEGSFTLDGSARVQIAFSADAACAGVVGWGDVEILDAAPGNADTWVPVATPWNVAPSGTTHAAAILVSWADIQDNPTRTHFDAAELDDGTIFIDGFESDDTSAWSSTVPPLEETGRLVGMTDHLNHSVRDEVDGGAAGPLPHLTWSGSLAAQAQAWADHLAANGCTAAPSGSGYAETLWDFYTDGDSGPTGEMVVDVWHSEMHEYTYGQYKVDDACTSYDTCDRYIQMVWRDTTTHGCGIGVCPEPAPGEYREIWCCFYDPPGKIVGEYPY
jgi:hypothetical protein